jgi:hypothetical protein
VYACCSACFVNTWFVSHANNKCALPYVPMAETNQSRPTVEEIAPPPCGSSARCRYC